jgi:hypothetical protein
MICTIADPAIFERLAAPFERASDALVRLDERLRSSPVAEAYIVRSHFQDACAALWGQGEFVQLEDLVLHDARMDARAPTHELVRADRVLTARRRIAGHLPEWALTDAGLNALRGFRKVAEGEAGAKAQDRIDEEEDDGELFEDDGEAGASSGEFAEIDALLARTSSAVEPVRSTVVRRDESGLVYDFDWDEEAQLAQWRAEVKATQALPPLIAAALAFEAWETVQPLQHQNWLGALLAAALLRSRGKTRHHLACLYIGFRHTKYRRSRQQDLPTRLAGFAQAVETMAELGLKEIERMTLCREKLLRKCNGRRGNSKLPPLVELCLRLPVVSVPLAAKELGVSQQAATTMIDALSSNLRELTERRRYRAWAVI